MLFVSHEQHARHGHAGQGVGYDIDLAGIEVHPATLGRLTQNSHQQRLEGRRDAAQAIAQLSVDHSGLNAEEPQNPWVRINEPVQPVAEVLDRLLGFCLVTRVDGGEDRVQVDRVGQLLDAPVDDEIEQFALALDVPVQRALADTGPAQPA